MILILRAERPLHTQRTNEIKLLPSYRPFNDNDKNHSAFINVSQSYKPFEEEKKHNTCPIKIIIATNSYRSTKHESVALLYGWYIFLCHITRKIMQNSHYARQKSET